MIMARLLVAANTNLQQQIGLSDGLRNQKLHYTEFREGTSQNKLCHFNLCAIKLCALGRICLWKRNNVAHNWIKYQYLNICYKKIKSVLSLKTKLLTLLCQLWKAPSQAIVLGYNISIWISISGLWGICSPSQTTVATAFKYCSRRYPFSRKITPKIRDIHCNNSFHDVHSL